MSKNALQASFSLPDAERCAHVKPLLRDTIDTLEINYIHDADARDHIENLSADISFLEDQLASLQQRKAAKQAQKDVVDKAMSDALTNVTYGETLMPGLCIRYCIVLQQ